jgi:hypothetical protein
MTTKKVLLALAATSLLAFGAVAPVYAEDPPPAGDTAKTQVPPDPDSADPGDATPDPGTDEGGGESGKDGGAAPQDGGAAPTDGGDQQPPQ